MHYATFIAPKKSGPPRPASNCVKTLIRLPTPALHTRSFILIIWFLRALLKNPFCKSIVRFEETFEPSFQHKVMLQVGLEVGT